MTQNLVWGMLFCLSKKIIGSTTKRLAHVIFELHPRPYLRLSTKIVASTETPREKVKNVLDKEFIILDGWSESQ